MRRLLLLLILGTIARAEDVVVVVMRGDQPEGDAWVTWDRPYGGGFREIFGTDKSGVASFKQPPGKMWIYAFHEKHGVVRKQIKLEPEKGQEVTLDLDNARPVTATLRVVDDKTGQPIPRARFKLIRSGVIGGLEGVERNRPHESKADAPDKVLGASCIPRFVEDYVYERAPPLFLRNAEEADKDGKIEILGLLPGSVDGLVEAEGYAPQWLGFSPLKREVRLRRGGSLDVDLGKTKIAKQLFCRITREDGFPTAAIMGAELDKDGRFVAKNLPPGMYHVQLTSWYPGPRGMSPSMQGQQVSHSSAPYEVREGQTTKCLLAAGTGKVVAGALPGAKLEQAILEGRDFWFSYIDRDGFEKFRFEGVPPGKYTLSLRSALRLECRAPIQVFAHADPKLPNLRRHHTSIAVVGTVKTRDGKPSRANLELWSLDTKGLHHAKEMLDRTTASHAGTFNLDAPGPGSYAVLVRAGSVFLERVIELKRGEKGVLGIVVPDTVANALTVRLVGPEGEPCYGTVELVGYPPLESTALATEHVLRTPRSAKYSIIARARRCADTKPIAVEIFGQGNLTVKLKAKR
ncbi:MAG: MSCRAMM family protein [Planctomycetota bacterium]